jgi:arylsulfatase
MVEEVDQAVGRVIEQLKDTGEYDNTVIFFLSDNGAEGRDEPTGLGEGPPDEMGSAGSYIQYGPGWAQAATSPSWRWKTFSSEGGIRTSAFVVGPGVNQSGAISSAYTNVTDIVPTALDMAGVAVEPGLFAGRKVQPIDGLSWMPLLKTGAQVYPVDKAIGTELFGSRSLRRGDWKITDIGDKRWRLFNIRHDPGETRDQSEAQPDRKAELLKDWDDYANSVNVVLPNPPLQPTPIKDAE